jgi:outer membrane cobalamin receptor
MRFALNAHTMIFMLATLLADPQTPSPVSEVIIVRGERLKSREETQAQVSLSGGQLQDQTGIRLDEALRIVPGLGLFRRTSSGAANATIQGLSLRAIAPNGAGRALVTLDGVPQNDPFGGWVNWGRYDPLFLNRVEIRRGGAGAGNGPMALTGVLGLIEARGEVGAANFSVGDLGSVHATARHSVRSPGAVFTAMAAYDATNGGFQISPRQRGPVDQKINSDIAAATLVTDVERSDGAWSVRASGFREAKGGGVVGAQSRAQGLDVSVARRIEGANGQARFLIYGQGRDFSNQSVAVSGGRTIATPSLDQFATPSSAIGGSIVLASNNWPNLTVDWRQAQGQTQELFRNLGGGFTRTRIAGGQQDLLGVGIEVPQPLRVANTGIAMEGALRLDYWSNTQARRIETDRASGLNTVNESPRDAHGTLVNGRVLAAIKDGALRLTAYRTFRPPTLNELHRPFRLGNDVTEANAALEPETLTGLDLDVRHVSAFEGGKLESTLTLFANRLDGPISNVTIGVGPGNFDRIGFLPVGGSLRERQNAGRINASGLEARIVWQGQVDQPSWQIAVTLTDATVNGGALLPQLSGNRPAQAAPWSSSASLTWPIANLGTVHAVIRGEGARFEDDLNSRKLAAYGAIDLRLERQITQHATLYVSVENALEESIPTGRTGDEVISLASGRIARIGLHVRR